MATRPIILKKVRVHNLQAVDLTLQPNQLIVFSGVSGSGKSSMAFDTLFTEGQRRYVESLSTQARRFMGDLTKPDAELIAGLSPTIAIEQKTAGRNPRSTVGTLTEIYDFIRVLYARLATPHCPVSGEPVAPESRDRIIRRIQGLPRGAHLTVMSPVARGQKGELKDLIEELRRKGFTHGRIDGTAMRLNDLIALDRQKAHDVDVVVVEIENSEAHATVISDAVTRALELSKGLCLIQQGDVEQLFSMHAYSPSSGLSYPALEPTDFSFNSASGMCPDCAGLGVIEEFDLDRIIDPEKSIEEDCCLVGSGYQTQRYGNIYRNLAELYGFKVTTPWKNLTEKARHVFLYGTERKWTQMVFTDKAKGKQWTEYVAWRGVLHEARERVAQAKSELYVDKHRALMTLQECPSCHGARLAPYPAAARFNGKRISEVTDMTVDEALTFFKEVTFAKEDGVVADELLKEIRTRLQFLKDVGLHYLTLSRTAPTLSGGEAQRVRLASQVGCGLVGVTYILDEPSIGLHPRDNQRLLDTLKALRDKGNTVVVVEHDEDTIRQADHVVDFGPGAGSEGGRIVVDGTVKDLLKSKESVTGAFLSGRRSIAVPKKRRKPTDKILKLLGATHHNLKNIDVEVPLGLFVAVTGVSGSGKSSLISGILQPALTNLLNGGAQAVGPHRGLEGTEHLDKVIAIDQSPIGRNPRSNPATYVKVFDEVRDLFSSLPSSMAKQYTPGRFSFNVAEGSCERCSGMGQLKVDLDFMEDAWVDCPLCDGRRFDSETLSVRYKDKNIADVLSMSVEQATEFFAPLPSIRLKLDTLLKVNLAYMRLGQPSPTLSGGEAQRIKLAKELARPAKGRTLYILDEPTTGLHFHDIAALLEVLHSLVERGNTVLVIEHNMEVVKTADWVIDLGPEGGAAGGKLVAQGHPEAIAKRNTPTGHAIAAALNPTHEQPKARKKTSSNALEVITIKKAEQNNLKQLDLTIPRGQITVCTGPSGSGKSSLAFETIYAEGQRRYIESLSPYARQFVQQCPKPRVESVEGLSPAIAIEQKATAGNPRSTVGTLTEIYDYLRVVYARLGTAHCPETGAVIRAISKETILERLMAYPADTRLMILAPIEKVTSIDELKQRLRQAGFLRLRINGQIHEVDDPIPFNKRRRNTVEVVIDRVKIAPEIRSRLLEALETAAKMGNDTLIALVGEEELRYNLSFSVEKTGKSYPPITPHTFSYNAPEGMCPQCQGIGTEYGLDPAQISTYGDITAIELLEHLWGYESDAKTLETAQKVLSAIGIELNRPLSKLSKGDLQLLLNGSEEVFDGLVWRGINTTLARIASWGHDPAGKAVRGLMRELPCLACQGHRLHALARHVLLEGVSLGALCQKPIDEVLAFVKSIPLSGIDAKVLDEVLRQLTARLQFLQEVGLDYLSLHRGAPTLSNGEAQRIRLARQLGTTLSGVLYVLDEPTVGLHPEDNHRLNTTLIKLRDLGNTLVLVEHDPLTMAMADHLIDLGPGAGREGGHIVAQGTLEEIKANPRSLTGAYLSGKRSVPVPKKRRNGSDRLLAIKHGSLNNLKDLSIGFPHEAFSVISGVSGGGKSTLLLGLIAPAVQMGLNRTDRVAFEGATVTGIEGFEQLIVLTQDPIGSTNRADVGTYVDVMPSLRTAYARSPDAKKLGLKESSFSTNHRSGMCPSCQGIGYRRVELQFLPAVHQHCAECRGLRLNPKSLQVELFGLNFGKLLDTTVTEVRKLFANSPKVVRILDRVIAVGLGYLKLGQEVATLSGGEAQRLKVSGELARGRKRPTLYLLDEPTKGLHFSDIEVLVDVLQTLVDAGHTVIAIEHNLDFIKQADFVVDLGPVGGQKGGYIVASGTPEELAEDPHSLTGKHLSKALKGLRSRGG